MAEKARLLEGQSDACNRTIASTGSDVLTSDGVDVRNECPTRFGVQTEFPHPAKEVRVRPVEEHPRFVANLIDLHARTNPQRVQGRLANIRDYRNHRVRVGGADRNL